MNFAPIHAHTMWSALDGLSTPLEMAQRCQCLGCTACGITDHGTVAGHIEFDRVMREHDIKPVFGCEFYHGVKTEFKPNERDQFHFVAGALTDEGLKNVWRLVDAASHPDRYRYVGRVNWEILKRHSEGVFATSACIQGLVAQSLLREETPPYLLGVLDRYLHIYRENFYIEIHTYPGEEHERLNHKLVGLAREKGIPLIFATDAHFAGPEQYAIHDAFVAMQTGETILMDPADRKMWHPKSLYIQSEQEIREHLSYLPDDVVDEALHNSGELAERVAASLPDTRRHIPQFVVENCPWQKAEGDPALFFIDLVERGIEWRYGKDAGPEVWEKAAYEIGVMLDAGLEHYFLQVWDLVEFCNSKGIIRGPGRGSAAGSIISYALGITDVDPLRYNLIFERFWNPGRAKGFPDIDLDFPTQDRTKVRDYLMQRWGEDRVRTIGTTMRMKPKAVLDKTYKVCGVTWDQKEAVKTIIANVPDIDIHGAETIGWARDTDPGKAIYVLDHVGNQIIEWLDEQPEENLEGLLRWLDIVEVLCGRISGYGVHPSGVVVSDVELSDELPCMYNRSKEVRTTCFPMSDVDKRGFLKDDLLGIRNLDTLQRWEQLRGEQVNWHALTYEQLPDEMWELLDRGLTLGIFQIEKGFARRLCKDMKVRSIDDLGVIVAVNRPGPIRAKVPESYVRRRFGQEEVTYDHPLLEEITRGTYGHLVYQEQIMAFFSALGYSQSDADEIRKILGKKKPEVMATVRTGEGEWEGKGYTRMALAAGIPQETVDLIWNKIEGFASYSFNAAHAICYATLAFRTLYAKWKDPAKFIIACIQTNPDDAGDYVSEARRMGVKIESPNFFMSSWDIEDREGAIYFGFSNIKGIGVGCAKYICQLRDRHDITSAEDLRRVLEEEQAVWEENKLGKSPRQKLPANRVDLLERIGAFGEEKEMRDLQEVEKELLGVIITDDCEEILSFNADNVEGCDLYSELETGEIGEKFQIPGIISTIRDLKTKKDNKSMGVVTVEYEGEQAEFAVFPKEWKNYRFMWKERTPVIIKVSKTERGFAFNGGQRLTA